MLCVTQKEKQKGILHCYLNIAFLFCSICFFSIFIVMEFKHSPLLTLICSVLLGIHLGHATGLQHELCHGILPSRGLNYWLGVVMGTILTISFTQYRLEHMQHHLFLGTPKNNEIFVRRDVESLSVWTLLFNLLMCRHYRDIVIAMYQSCRKDKKFFGDTKQSHKILFEYRVMLCFFGVLFFLLCLYGPFIVLYVWLIPVCLIALPIKSMIEIAEHYGCNTTTTNIFKNSRVIKGGFSAWLTNGNNYHVVHHLYPKLPLSLTKKMYARLEEETENVERSYVCFYLSLVYRLIKHKKAV